MRLALTEGEASGSSAPSDPSPCRPEEAGAEVPPLPLDALRVLAEQLDQGDLEQTLLLLKLFVILCRWVPASCPRWGAGLGWGTVHLWPLPSFTPQEPGERGGRLGAGAGAPRTGTADPVGGQGAWALPGGGDR